MATPTEIVVTLYGTDANFVWSADGSTIQQANNQTGPFTYSMPYAGKPVYVNAGASYNSVTDVGCTVTLGDKVLMDKREPGQLAAMCMGSVG